MKGMVQQTMSSAENQVTVTETLPHSREAEEAVLGAILINPQVYFDIAPYLSVEDFFIRRNGYIWQAITRLMERNVPIDILTINEELDQMGLLTEVGGPAYLSILVNNVPTTLHAEAYAKIMVESAVRRRMLQAANEIAKLAFSSDISVETAMDEAAKAVFNVGEGRIKSELKPISEVVSEYDRHISALVRRGTEAYGVLTGFIDLDRLLIGMQPSDFLIIAGRPGQGKTGFLISVAKNAAQMYNKHVAIFSLEMSNEQLVQRLIAQETGIDSQRLRTGKLQDDEWELFYQACASLSKTYVFLDDTPAITPMQMRTKCRRLHLEYNLDLIVVDYIQLMTTGRRVDNRVQEVSEISRQLKSLARELNVPVLAAAQLSRAVEQRADKQPVLSDLRESGSLEQDADVVMFIYRPDAYDKDSATPNLAKILVSKHRNGPTGSIDLVFRSKLAKFENAVTRHIDLSAL